MSVRIVLFGPNGQVGARLMTQLSDAGYDVMGIDRARCDFATATAKEIAPIIRAVEPHLVINAAAYTAVDKAESEQQLAHRLNAEVPELIAAAAQEQHVPFLHFSTDYVFDGLRGAPYVPDATVNPLSVYAASKRAGEEGVLRHGGTVFRLQWVFDSKGKNFFLTIKKLLAEKDELRIVADQIGSPSNALHIAQSVVKAAPLMMDGTLTPGMYHLTAGGHTSWHGLTCAIATAVKSQAHVVPIVTSEYATAATRPKDARLDCSALASHGIAMPDWREGLAQAMKDEYANS